MYLVVHVCNIFTGRGGVEISKVFQCCCEDVPELLVVKMCQSSKTSAVMWVRKNQCAFSLLSIRGNRRRIDTY